MCGFCYNDLIQVLWNNGISSVINEASDWKQCVLIENITIDRTNNVWSVGNEMNISAVNCKKCSAGGKAKTSRRRPASRQAQPARKNEKDEIMVSLRRI